MFSLTVTVDKEVNIPQLRANLLASLLRLFAAATADTTVSQLFATARLRSLFSV